MRSDTRRNYEAPSVLPFCPRSCTRAPSPIFSSNFKRERIAIFEEHARIRVVRIYFARSSLRKGEGSRGTREFVTPETEGSFRCYVDFQDPSHDPALKSPNLLSSFLFFIFFIFFVRFQTRSSHESLHNDPRTFFLRNKEKF